MELVLRDPARFSSRVNADTMGPVMGTMLVAMDGEEHRRYRNLVAHAFRPSALARWESELIGPTIHRLIDGLAGRTDADLVAEITSQFPVQVIAGVIGIPVEDHDRFHAWALDMNKGPDDYPASIAASARHAQLPHAHRRGPQGPTRPTTSCPTSSPPRSTASASTTSTSTGSSACSCRRAPRRRSRPWAIVCSLCSPAPTSSTGDATPTRALLDAVIEETLRWETSVTMVNRETTCPVDIEGVTVPQGVSLVCATGSANRDESRYDDPATWDLDRDDPGHIAFGTGRHQCLGMHLARLEASASGYGALLDRLTGLRLDPDSVAGATAGAARRSAHREASGLSVAARTAGGVRTVRRTAAA